MGCKHERLEPTVQFAVEHRTTDQPGGDGGIVVDVWCKGCGKSGSLIIQPDDVQWSDEDEPEDRLTDENGEPRTCILTGEPGENADDCKTHHHEVTCSICKNECAVETAHLHQGEWIGDECCWDDRLKASE